MTGSDPLHHPALTVVTLTDERYAMPLATMVRSLLDNLRREASLCLYVIDGGLTRASKQRLVESWADSRLSVEWVSPQYGDGGRMPIWGRMPALTYARIFVPDLLPATCAKAIFLDSDLLVVADLARLWGESMRGQPLLAAQDPAIPFIASRDGLKNHRQLGIQGTSQYFCAAVMVMDLHRWRAESISSRVMSFVVDHAADLRCYDQDGLNASLCGHWGALDLRWQVNPRFVQRHGPGMPHLDPRTVESLRADPWILHFGGRLKPWHYRGSTTADQAFFHYVDRTSWAGWRPAMTPRALAYRLYDSSLRGWVYPIEQWSHALLRRFGRRRSHGLEHGR